MAASRSPPQSSNTPCKVSGPNVGAQTLPSPEVARGSWKVFFAFEGAGMAPAGGGAPEPEPRPPGDRRDEQNAPSPAEPEPEPRPAPDPGHPDIPAGGHPAGAPAASSGLLPER